MDGYPGIVRDVQTYLKERIREVLTGTGYAVVVRVYGDDLATLRQEADKIKAFWAVLTEPLAPRSLSRPTFRRSTWK